MGDERGRFLTTEYTEAVEPLLKNTEQVQRYSGLEGLESTPSKPVLPSKPISVYSVWERKRPFSVFCGKFSRHFGLKGLMGDECVECRTC